MTHAKMPYTKHATDYDKQIQLLRSRGVIIIDEDKAKEYLSDIGYYRLGFYVYPFELTYPSLGKLRTHNVKQGTRIEDIVALYYYDLDLRNILNRFLSRIEVAIRTTLIYELSNKYQSNPYWYVDPNVVEQRFIHNFTTNFYPKIKEKEPIKRHHKKYLGKYAPAWKAMEYMTLGNLEKLYGALRYTTDRSLISSKFGEPSISAFNNYLSVIREVRNSCAHGNVIVGMTMSTNVRTGVASPYIPMGMQNTFGGAMCVIDYLLNKVSANRANDMKELIKEATLRLYSAAPSVRQLIESKTGFVV